MSDISSISYCKLFLPDLHTSRGRPDYLKNVSGECILILIRKVKLLLGVFALWYYTFIFQKFCKSSG